LLVFTYVFDCSICPVNVIHCSARLSNTMQEITREVRERPLKVLSTPAFSSMLSIPTFNPLVCAAIHNKIVSRIATTAYEDYDNDIIHNYFVAYDDADKIRSRLSEPLITFLENIDVPIGLQAINIAPHARLSNPEDLWAAIGGIDVLDHGIHENWVALYRGISDCNLKTRLPIVNSGLTIAKGTAGENDLYFDLDLSMCTWLKELDPWPIQW